MLRVLLAKDLRRAWRNPLPWIINLIVPLAMTALIGLAFGGNSSGGALGRIRFAVVDEDKTPLSEFLRGAASQRQGGKYLEPVFLEREEAMRELNANSRNFQSQFPELQAVFDGAEDYHKVSGLIERVGDKLKAAKPYINPPL